MEENETPLPRTARPYIGVTMPYPSRLAIPRSLFDADLEEVAAWAVTICLTFGSSVHTAYFVAAEFTRGVAELRHARALEQP